MTNESKSFKRVSRRQFLNLGVSGFAACALSNIAVAADKIALADSNIIVLSDGYLELPADFIFHDSIAKDERDAFANKHGLSSPFKPPCNVTLWQVDDKLVLFDTGAGSNFMSSAGQLLADLETAGIDPADITDVLYTHAHPDHLWGLLDDFDDLAFPNANYFMNSLEWDFWRASDTLDKMSEARKTFVVGAQNRLALLEDRISLFAYGDEVIGGVEAVDTRGHTPGHTSFAIHREGQSLLVLGDAATHPIISFEKADWPSGSDQDAEAGKTTRLRLLDRLATEQTAMLGFHMPYPGIGRVERAGELYKFVPS